MKAIKFLIVLIILVVVGALAYAYSGVYNIAVGTGHNPVTAWYIEMARERSVEVRAEDIEVPNNLNSPARTQAGAGHYKDMCAGCHGFPGQPPANVFEPQPPALYEHVEEPAETFWIIRNGIKASAMPRHEDHSDEDIWNIVAFLQKLPSLTPAEYEQITAGATHSHADGSSHSHEEPSMEQATAPDERAESALHSHEVPRTPVAVLDAFHHALHEGNASRALALLHEQATILEGGQMQNKAEYAAGHLASDMAFVAQVEVEPLSQDVTLNDSQAVISSKARMTGEVDGEAVDSVMAETATLVKTDSGWRIVQLIWTQEAPAAADTEPDETVL